MTPFPEEPLDSPAGYFAAQPGQTFDKGDWTIVRKLGWGSRSSSWLAVATEDPEDYEVLKIFTRAATEDPATTAELELLCSGPLGGQMPTLVKNFYEEGPKGQHLCMVFLPLGGSVESLRLSGGNVSGGSFPVHMVQKFVVDILEPLTILDKLNIIHGAVTSSNLLFSSGQAAPDIRESLAKSEPLAPVEMVTGKDGEVYPAAKSQPLDHGIRWNSSREVIDRSCINLCNFVHARKAPATGTLVLDGPPNCLPPEALQGPRIVTTKANIWQLGCLVYFLLTGAPLFSLSDAESPTDIAIETLSKLEDLLTHSGKVPANDISASTSFIRSCLTVNPDHRPNALDLFGDNWVQLSRTCSCVSCLDDDYSTTGVRLIP